MASFLQLREYKRRTRRNRRLFPCGHLPAHSDWCGTAHSLAQAVGHTDDINTVRSSTMGKTTDKIKEGIKDTAGAVKRGAEKAKDAAMRGVDKSKDAAARTAEKVKDKTDRAAEKVKEA